MHVYGVGFGCRVHMSAVPPREASAPLEVELQVTDMGARNQTHAYTFEEQQVL